MTTERKELMYPYMYMCAYSINLNYYYLYGGRKSSWQFPQSEGWMGWMGTSKFCVFSNCECAAQ